MYQNISFALSCWHQNIRRPVHSFMHVHVLTYRVAHLLWERDMLTPNLKLRSAATPARPARPVTELWIWCQHKSFPKQMGHPVLRGFTGSTRQSPNRLFALAEKWVRWNHPVEWIWASSFQSGVGSICGIFEIVLQPAWRTRILKRCHAKISSASPSATPWATKDARCAVIASN